MRRSRAASSISFSTPSSPRAPEGDFGFRREAVGSTALERRSRMMHGSTTVFTVKDVMASLAYYRDKIGFDVAFEYGTPTFYVGLCSGDVTLHLVSAGKTPRQPGHGAVTIFVDDVD